MTAPVTEWVVRSPAPPLRAFVDRYIGYRQAGFPAGLHQGLPSRHMTLVASIGEPVDVVAQTDPRQPPRRYRVVAGGLQAAPATIRHPGAQEGVQVELTPLGSRALLGMPAAELWDRSERLADVVGAAGVELWERLQSVAGWDARFAVMDDVLGRSARDATVAPELRHAWGELVRSGGAVPVAELAAEVGYTRQHLGRRFAAEYGLSPKLAGRVIRFGRAARLLQATARPIAEVALACGYYDQAHLHRDCAEFASTTPAGLRREEIPFFQDPVAALEAYSPP